TAKSKDAASEDKNDKRWAGKKVLIIEPFKGSRDLLKDLIEQWSVVASTAESVDAGLSQLQKTKSLAIIFVSAHLHPTDEEMSLLRDAAPRSKFILLTSSGDSIYRAQADELGFTTSVLMPLRRKYINRALHAGLLGRRPKSSSLRMAINPNFARELPLSILVAEDNRTNQKVIQMVLKKLGYTADVVANGLEAIEALRSKDYDVILMDMHMPEMDGLTATKTIRKDFPEDKQPKIIALTANVLPEQKMECRNAGMDDFVGKPLQIQELTKALLRCV
ncbi:MAG: response regulator, partial [Planctomycetota bacterium]|nr:response regulator [Planctomycetota bacterium]